MSYWQVVETPVHWRADDTMLVIVDKWNKHWCTNGCEAPREMLPRFNEVVKHARNLGVQIIHSPTEPAMGLYYSHPSSENEALRKSRGVDQRSRQSGKPPCILRVASAASKCSGSNDPPHHSRCSVCSSCAGSSTACKNSSYPQTPPTSSGGQLRSPPRQTGYRFLASGAITRSSNTSCSQPSPKSYS